MEIHFKLGDKVVIQGGAHRGREAHIIGITRDGRSEPTIMVRLYASPSQEAAVAIGQLRKAQ